MPVELKLWRCLKNCAYLNKESRRLLSILIFQRTGLESHTAKNDGIKRHRCRLFVSQERCYDFVELTIIEVSFLLAPSGSIALVMRGL